MSNREVLVLSGSSFEIARSLGGPSVPVSNLSKNHSRSIDAVCTWLGGLDVTSDEIASLDRILVNGKFEGDLFAFEATLAERVALRSGLCIGARSD